MAKFWRNSNMQNSAYTKSLNMELYLNWVAKYKIFVKNKKIFAAIKNVEKLKFGGDWVEL